jgi:phosphoribosylaminoimidazole-succinocarboxamide synthase
MGSVKDFQILQEALMDTPGRARFTFSDRYSIFDWGEMPDNIQHKGAAISLLVAYFLEKLEKQGIPTHYLGLVEEGIVKQLSQVKKPVNVMEVELLRIIPPKSNGKEYDYSGYAKEKSTFLIPLEVIYRNSLPPGSSVFKRLENGQITPEDLGLKEMPVPDQKFDKPIIDVSTKLEITDRYINWNEAGQISGLSKDEITSLKELTCLINDMITTEFLSIGLVNEDGKIEVGFDKFRRLMLVDVLGTLDECRFTMDGLPVSKEIARIFYRDTPWSRDVDEAKQKDRQNWKKICCSAPPPLPSELKHLISQVYCACTNEITKKEWFPDIPSLKDLCKDIQKLLKGQTQ